MTLRDLYKKHHWQLAGPTFYQLHLLFDRHYEQQNESVDAIAERIQLLCGVSIAMGLTRVVGHLPRGGYDVQNGSKQDGTTGAAAVHRGVHGRRGPARVG